MGYAAGIALAATAHHDRGLDAHRHRSARDADRDVQPAAGDRAAAARAAVVRARATEPRLRDRAFGAVGGRAQHALGLPVGVARRCAWPATTTGSRGLRYVGQILIPAAFPSILTGLKIGWAFAWRTLIAAELVFGVSSRSGGLGWFIFENKNQLEIAAVFAGLLTVILIGLFVESVIFRDDRGAHRPSLGHAELMTTHLPTASYPRFHLAFPVPISGGESVLRRRARLPGGPIRRPLGRLRPLRPPDRRPPRPGRDARRRTGRVRATGHLHRRRARGPRPALRAAARGPRVARARRPAGRRHRVGHRALRALRRRAGRAAHLFLLDPIGNALEFKAFGGINLLFAKKP